jgi:tetraacyldisaccharide 4'-kinase
MGSKPVNTSQSLRQKVESVMASEGSAPRPFLAAALYPISLAYGAAQKLRAFAYRRRLLPSHRLPCRVICVGNITVGGTGKTPMTMYAAQKIKQLGYRTAVVSRGYGGRAESRGGIVSDGQSIRMGPEGAGDEPYLIACGLKDVPVLVGKNRYASGMLALKEFQPDVIVLDDGFQHLRLQRDIDLVLLDHALPFGSGHLLPRGILREPLSALARSSACVLTRCPAGRGKPPAFALDLIKKYAPCRPVFTSSHTPYTYLIEPGEPFSVDATAKPCPQPVIDRLVQDRVFGFSGIARNAEFQNTVKDLGFNARGFMEFSDHHRYSVRDLSFIQSKAERAGARCLITTEKDLVRLSPQNPFPLQLFVVGVKISLGNYREQFISFLERQLAR